MDATALLTLTQWLSPAYPTGAFVWSHGLEAAVAEGDVADGAALEDWLADVLGEGAGRSDAILLVSAHGAEGAALADLADLAAALAPSAARRAETVMQGAAFARVTRDVWGHDLPDMPLPVAVGRAAALQGLPLEPVAQVYLQAMVSNLIAAALRLMPLGQTEGQRILARLGPVCARVATAALGQTIDDIGSATMAIDIASMRQEALRVRVFRS
jgi:urease accessory protein